MPSTPRLGLPYPALSDIADVPADMGELALQLDTSVPYGQGPIANRPISTPGSPGIQGRVYLATDSTPYVLSVDHGTGWQNVGVIAAGSIGTTELADRSVTGIKIALETILDENVASGAIGTTEIADLAVTAAKIAAALKPSQGAGASTEALRALGVGPGLALGYNDIPNLYRVGTLAARPAANSVGAGTIYWATDQDATYRSDGAAWVRFGARAGDLVMTLNSSAEPGRVLCQGQVWPAIDGIYTDLYTKWGGSNLPDLRGRVPVVVSPGGKALVDTVRDNDGRAANLRSISHRHQQDPQTSYKDVAAGTSGSQWTGDVRTGYTSGDSDNTDYPAFYVVNAEAKL